jgi:hypothetical protein
MFIFRNPDRKLSIFQNFDADRGLKQSQNASDSPLQPRSNRAGQKINQKLGPKGSKSIAELWTAALDQYEHERKHQEFIRACFRSGCLYYAAQKYARILTTSPNDLIATKMQNQIDVFARKDSFIRPSQRRLPARAIRFIDFAAIIGLLLTLIGVVYSGQRELVGAGLSTLILSLGAKYFFSRT